MSESAKVIIDAEDLASKKYAEAARNAERAIKSVKETGQKAKASTEFFGTLANSLGGTELGSYAMQLGGLTEKVGQFSEISKAGSAGALAFKAGLVGLAGVLSFQVGKAIGDAIFQTEKWRKELEKAAEESKRLDAEFAKAMGRRFEYSKEEISLIGDPDEQRAATAELLKDIEKQIADTQAQIASKQNRQESTWEAWMMSPEELEAMKDTSSEQSRLDVLREQRDELQDQLSLRRQMLDERKAEIEAEKEAEKERIKAVEDAEKAAEAARQKAADQAAAQAQKLADLKRNEINAIEQQRIALTQGAEAAKAFALEQQGVDADTAKRIAAMHSENKTTEEMLKLREKLVELSQGGAAARVFQLTQSGVAESVAQEIARVEQLLEESQKQTPSRQVQPLAAVESRLLTRGPTNDPMMKVIDNTKMAADELRKLNARQEREQANRQRPIVLERASA